MPVPMAYLKALTDAVNAISAAGQNAALATITRTISNGEYTDPFDAVDDVLEEVESLFQAVTDRCASISATSYDLVRNAATGETLGAKPFPDHEREWTREALFGIAKDHRHNMGAFVRGILDRMDYEAKRAAGSTQFMNGNRDSAKPRFARVPTGPETCPFCIMLASRGFVYWSEKTAGKLDHYHPNCDCRIVPSFDSFEVITAAGAKRRLSMTTVEGYDPNKYFDQYIEDLASGKLNFTTTAKYAPTKKVIKRFGSIRDAQNYAMGAKDMEDLQGRLNELNELLKKENFPGKSEEDRKRIYEDIIRYFRRRYQELLEETGIEYDSKRYPSSVAGVKRGDPMDFDSADGGRANPHYTDENARKKGYVDNCQTCVVANELRRRGYNVEALPNNGRNKTIKSISRRTNYAWIDPKTGEPPEYMVSDEVKSAPTAVQWLEDVIEDGGRYTIEFGWKGRRRTGHIICIDRDDAGALRMFDPQTNEHYSGDAILDYLKKVKYKTSSYGTTYATPPKVLRVDTMEPNLENVDDILTKAGT